MGSTLRLYHYWRSSSSWRVRWALQLKKVEVEYVAINLLKEENQSPGHLGRNPHGTVPVLEFLDSPSGILTESLPIMEWLEETYPTPSLLPGNPRNRAQIRRLAEIVNSGTQPLQNLSVQKYYSEDVEKKKTWSQKWITKGLNTYEKTVEASAGKFSVGDTVTLADLCLIPQCYNANRFEVDFKQFPTIYKIYQNAIGTPEYQASHPDQFKDAHA